jgi:hypothetical protein
MPQQAQNLAAQGITALTKAGVKNKRSFATKLHIHSLVSSRVFQHLTFFTLPFALFPIVFWDERPGAYLGMLVGELCVLWLVGLAFFVAHPVFYGNGLVVWHLDQLFV